MDESPDSLGSQGAPADDKAAEAGKDIAQSTGNGPDRPRKVYESNLLPDRRRNRVSPWVAVAVIAAIGALCVYVMMNGKRRREVVTVGQIAYAARMPGQTTSRIWLAGLDGGHAQAVTPVDADADSPSYSGDGDQIVYIQSKGGVRQVYRMDGDGMNPIAVTSAGSSKSSPQFVPSDNTRVGYLSGGALFESHVDTQDTDRIYPPPPDAIHGTGKDEGKEPEVMQTASGPAIVRFQYAPSDDPLKQPLGIVEEENGVQMLALLPTGSGAAIVADEQNRPYTAAPSVSFGWSPDGSKLTCALLGIPGPNKFIVNTLKTITANNQIIGSPLNNPFKRPEGFENPVYSPSGNLIAVTYWFDPDAANRQCLGLAIIPADWSQPPHPILKGSAEDVQFSADGQFLLFLAKRKDGGHDLYKQDINGNNAPVKISDGTQDVLGFTVSDQEPRK